MLFISGVHGLKEDEIYMLLIAPKENITVN